MLTAIAASNEKSPPLKVMGTCHHSKNISKRRAGNLMRRFVFIPVIVPKVKTTSLAGGLDFGINSIEEGIATASAKQRLNELEEKKADLDISLAREKIEKVPLTKAEITAGVRPSAEVGMWDGDEDMIRRLCGLA